MYLATGMRCRSNTGVIAIHSNHTTNNHCIPIHATIGDLDVRIGRKKGRKKKQRNDVQKQARLVVSMWKKRAWIKSPRTIGSPAPRGAKARRGSQWRRRRTRRCRNANTRPRCPASTSRSPRDVSQANSVSCPETPRTEGILDRGPFFHAGRREQK